MQTTRYSDNKIDTGETNAGLHGAVHAALAAQPEALADIMRAHNQRMFRIARSIMRDDADAEDIVQEAFIRAFTKLDTLNDSSSLGAWLARITANLAISRLRQKKRHEQVITPDQGQNSQQGIENLQPQDADHLSPERLAAIGDIRKLLEQQIDKLPDGFREVFVLREVEQMSTSECALALDIRPATVKTRLHRAKTMLRDGLQDHITAVSLQAFPFGGKRCARTTETVLQKLRELVATPSGD